MDNTIKLSIEDACWSLSTLEGLKILHIGELEYRLRVIDKIKQVYSVEVFNTELKLIDKYIIQNNIIFGSYEWFKKEN